MRDEYVENSGWFKALAHIKRFMIVDMLSCGELCACEISEKFNITQPTLSYHMKILCDCGLVSGRKVGKWMYYALDEKKVQDFKNFLYAVTIDKEDCIFKEGECGCGKE